MWKRTAAAASSPWVAAAASPKGTARRGAAPAARVRLQRGRPGWTSEPPQFFSDPSHPFVNPAPPTQIPMSIPHNTLGQQWKATDGGKRGGAGRRRRAQRLRRLAARSSRGQNEERAKPLSRAFEEGRVEEGRFVSHLTTTCLV